MLPSNLKKLRLKALALPVLLLLMQSCHIGESLPENRNIYVDLSGIEVRNTTSMDYTKYVNNHSVQEYQEAFMKGLTSTMTSYNVTVVQDPAQADFIVKVERIDVQESSETHTVRDEDSEYNGATYFLHTCEVSADGSVHENGSNLTDVHGLIDKEEKVKNNRNLGDLLTGSNQDNNTYRHKEFSSDIFIDLSERAGNRMGSQITRKLARYIKKGRI